MPALGQRKPTSGTSSNPRSTDLRWTIVLFRKACRIWLNNRLMPKTGADHILVRQISRLIRGLILTFTNIPANITRMLMICLPPARMAG